MHSAVADPAAVEKESDEKPQDPAAAATRERDLNQKRMTDWIRKRVIVRCFLSLCILVLCCLNQDNLAITMHARQAMPGRGPASGSPD